MRIPRTSARHTSFGFVLLALSLAAPGEAGDPPLPSAAVDAVAGLATELANRGLVEEAEEVLEVLEVLGVPGEPRERARKAIAKRGAGSARPPGRADPAAVRRVAAALADAAAAAPEGPRRRTIAEQALRLSGREPKANRVLGHVEVEGQWVPAGSEGVPARRAAIAEAVARARSLEIPVAIGDADHPELVAVVRGARAARGPDASVQSARLTPQEMSRVVRTASRVLAFSWWTHTGTVAVPPARSPVTALVFSTEAQYTAWLEARRAEGRIKDSELEFAKSLSSWWCEESKSVGIRPDSVDKVTRTLTYHLWWNRAVEETGVQPTACLRVGHVNWCSLLVAGLPITRLAALRETEEGGARTTDAPERRLLRTEREAAAGLLGTRAWLRERARRGTDPPWRQCFVLEAAKIGGTDLLKATSVAEHLAETGRFWDVAKEAGYAAEDLEAGLAQALGTPVGEYEARWRDWLLADGNAGLAERLERLGTDPETRGDGWMAALDEARRVALLGGWTQPAYLPLRTDPDLSEGCRAHAKYLLANPDLAKQWPDMHEERMERPGYSAAGARAAGASVIYPGVRSVAEAVDGWMATFYHRLPLLDPGLVRVGVGREKGTVVVDTQSMVVRPVSGTVVWPAPDAAGVPRRFASGELPHPVPGEDPSVWGFPITVQVFPEDGEDIDIRIEVRKGGAAGPLVDGHLLTPSRHAQPAFHPPRASCFIPKAPLDAGTLYHVHTSGYLGAVPTYDWSFTTGKR